MLYKVECFFLLLWFVMCGGCRPSAVDSQVISSQEPATVADGSQDAQSEVPSVAEDYRPQERFVPQLFEPEVSILTGEVLKSHPMEASMDEDHSDVVKNDTSKTMPTMPKQEEKQPNAVIRSFAQLIKAILSDADHPSNYTRAFRLGKTVDESICEQEETPFLQKQCKLSSQRMRPEIVRFKGKALLYRRTHLYKADGVATAVDAEVKVVKDHIRDFSRTVFWMSLGRIVVDVDVKLVEDHALEIGDNGRFRHSSIRNHPEMGFKFNRAKFNTLTTPEYDFYIVVRKKANKTFAWGSAYGLDPRSTNPYPGDIEVYYENLQYNRQRGDEISGLVHEFVHVLENWFTGGQLVHQTSAINPWHTRVHNSWVTWYRAILEGKVPSITGDRSKPQTVKQTGRFLSDRMLHYHGTRLQPPELDVDTKRQDLAQDLQKYKVVGHALHNPPLRVNESYLRKPLVRGGFKVARGLGLHPKQPLSYVVVVPPFETGGHFWGEVGYTMVDTTHAVNFRLKECAAAQRGENVQADFSLLIYGVFSGFRYQRLWASGVQTACTVPRAFWLGRTYMVEGKPENVEKFILVVHPLQSMHSDHVGLFEPTFLLRGMQRSQSVNMGLVGEALIGDFEQVLWD
ncbi:MAG: hypothetical protein OXT67_11325 [Zetaproteobacteria bacterium]|nr:hypothetical protein [Zetaproteobacteria bacterium]